MPYLKVKLDHVYLKLQEIDDATPLRLWHGCGLKHAAAVLFFRVYPYLCCLWEVSGTPTVFINGGAFQAYDH